MNDVNVRAMDAERLARNLMRELFQTETSALRHCQREADRQPPSSGPQLAMLAVAEHAAAVLPQLRELSQRNGLPFSRGGRVVGRLFSEARDKALDMLINAERSYRGTLLGTRHGVDLVRSLGWVAREAGRDELARFCDDWLERREPLVAALAGELRWFAQHPGEARLPARSARRVLKRARARAEAKERVANRRAAAAQAPQA